MWGEIAINVAFLTFLCTAAHPVVTLITETATTPTPTVTLKSLKDCQLRINEMKGNLVDGLGRKEFLEFMAVCSTRNSKVSEASIFGHKIVFLSAKSTNDGGGVILGTMSLKSYKLSDNGFFNVGGA